MMHAERRGGKGSDTMSSRRKLRRGFTLIEILVVIAVIAILAAILFPVFAMAREKARSAVCLSNQKQLASAMAMYVQDYDERFPIWRYFVPISSEYPNGEVTWVENLQPYAKNRKIWLCPGDTTSYLDRTKPSGQNSYWLNAYLFRWSGNEYQNKWPSLTLAEVPYPATTIVFCDGPTNDGNHVWPGPPHEWCGTTRDCINSETRHSGGIYFAFADAHVKWYRVEQLKTTVPANDALTDNMPQFCAQCVNLNLYSLRKPRGDGQNPWWRP
jgi:prepilin-type N-terminal cleavage/methylation domain-containing protein/prepilin-type processing-associated H-X9-DG protein